MRLPAEPGVAGDDDDVGELMRTYIGHGRAGQCVDRNNPLGIISPLMNSNGSSQFVTNGACLAPLDAIVRLAAINDTKCPLAHLILWVSREQRVRE